jgi:hypothetical protein
MVSEIIIEENDKNCFDKIDDLWEQYKYNISGKASITLAITAGFASILVSKVIIPATVLIAITNIGVFFAGISLQSITKKNDNLNTENNNLNTELISLKSQVNESRNISIKNNSPIVDSLNISSLTDTPKTIYEIPQDFNLMYTNNKENINPY